MKKYLSLDLRFGQESAMTLEEMAVLYRLYGWDETDDGWIMSDIAILSDILDHGVEEI